MYYYNTCNQRFYLPEQPLEPRDCWYDKPEDEDNDEDEQEDD